MVAPKEEGSDRSIPPKGAGRGVAQIKYLRVEVMDIQGHAPFRARGGRGGASYGLDMV